MNKSLKEICSKTLQRIICNFRLDFSLDHIINEHSFYNTKLSNLTKTKHILTTALLILSFNYSKIGLNLLYPIHLTL